MLVEKPQRRPSCITNINRLLASLVSTIDEWLMAHLRGAPRSQTFICNNTALARDAIGITGILLATGYPTYLHTF
eukprot:4475682-Pyramimonas_sp.AAC.1